MPRTTVVNTGPVAVPYTLTETNHILIRLKINGKGPFNFIVDTGAPLMILRTSAADKIGLRTNSRGFTTLKQLDIEGGLSLNHVQCLVETPYQIEGMNAIGASGVELDGMLGYGVLARFRMQIDLSKDRMIWTPVNFTPEPFVSSRIVNKPPVKQSADHNEDHLESVGGLMKILGPLIKPVDLAAQHRGLVGIELSDANGSVSVQRVLGDSPAEKAGIRPGDRVLSVNKKPVQSIADAQRAMANTLTNQPANLVVQRDDATLSLQLICSEGL